MTDFQLAYLDMALMLGGFAVLFIALMFIVPEGK